ncbi:MAG TPA: DUF5678 domain-containing protein [Candidatus Acidoferrales bacterium]|jgi:hypothetical protein|nr:DUF5678 domain-containing protein [Candidatus Acidoferrales bacterium]
MEPRKRHKVNKDVVVFEQTNQITANKQGVFVPQSLFGEGTRVRHAVSRNSEGGVCVWLSSIAPAAAPKQGPNQTDNCQEEQHWLAENRSEYAGQWVALDGNKLLAHGPTAHEVYEQARASGVALPLVVQVEPPDQLPFGGW